MPDSAAAPNTTAEASSNWAGFIWRFGHMSCPVKQARLLIRKRAMTESLWRRTRELPAKLKAAVYLWSAHEGTALGASIAFYSIFALAPLLVISIAVAGLAFGPEAVRGQVVEQFGGLIGTEAAEAMQDMIIAAWRPGQGVLASLIALATLLVAATGVLVELKRALNSILDIAPVDQSFLSALVRARVIALAMVLGFGFLLIVSLLLSAAVAAAGAYLPTRYPQFTAALALLDIVFSLVVLTAAFAGLVRWLPDRPPPWRAVWISALTSAVLFSIGKYLVGLYLARAALTTTYGAAGSFVVLIMWVYFSAQVLLLGVSFGRQYAPAGAVDEEPVTPSGTRPVARTKTEDIGGQRAGST
jgi:membrane protein